MSMPQPEPEPLFMVDEYLARERATEDRHEFLDGHILAMAGESPNHGTISVNLVGIFYVQLKGTRCEAFTKDTKIRSGPTPMTGRGTRGLFSYPDVAVVCGEPEFHDAHRDIILNPKVLVEVLSPKTEALDRGAKFDRYQTFSPTLTDYVLVAQDQPRVEHYRRQADGSWIYRAYLGRDAAVVVDPVSCTLKLADSYDRIQCAEEDGSVSPASKE